MNNLEEKHFAAMSTAELICILTSAREVLVKRFSQRHRQPNQETDIKGDRP